MPILRYIFFVGCSLLGLLLVAERTVAPTTSTMSGTSTSLDVLRKMANHGGTRGFAPLADAGVFLPVPVATQSNLVAQAEPTDHLRAIEVVKPTPAAQSEKPTLKPTLLDAQARVAESDIVYKPARPAKRTVTRRPKYPHSVYVENPPRGPSGIIGTLQSW